MANNPHTHTLYIYIVHVCVVSHETYVNRKWQARNHSAYSWTCNTICNVQNVFNNYVLVVAYSVLR